ncbi:MAG: CopG family transcriptional regulator [Gammaproteobacteria bacterium]|nr:CopG family transcriptional regulator [Gammaproteobacteria bacterium]
MKANEFDEAFDEGQDLTDMLDVSKARRPKQAQRRVNVDFPTWMIDRLDKEASRLGVTRQSIIKVWLSERMEAQDKGRGDQETRNATMRDLVS